MDTYEKLKHCVSQVRQKTDFVPKLLLILGSGLGDFARNLKAECIIPYADIEGFPRSTAPGHEGRFIFGHLGEVSVVIMQGRVHFYEGYEIGDVVLPVRLARMLGAKALFLTNAAGGVNPEFSPGDFMLIQDQIASFVPSPLVGKNIEELGVRFPDMSRIYDLELAGIIEKQAAVLGIGLKKGVYVQLTGPAFETPAEVAMCRILGGDAVGMSTACEAVAARHCGLRVCGISCISNMAAGMNPQELSSQEVEETTSRVAGEFKALVEKSMEAMGAVL